MITSIGFEFEQWPKTVTELSGWVINIAREDDLSIQAAGYLNRILDLDAEEDPGRHPFISLENWAEGHWAVSFHTPGDSIVPGELIN